MLSNKRSGKFAVILIAAIFLGMARLTDAQIPTARGEGQPSAGIAANPLTPEALGMPRSQINFDDRNVRLFNGRGAVSIRDESLTGLQFLKFPPIDLRDWRFSLAFKETKANLLSSGRRSGLLRGQDPELEKSPSTRHELHSGSALHAAPSAGLLGTWNVFSHWDVS